MRRTLIGILGLAAVVFGVLANWLELGAESSAVEVAGNSCLRIGIVLVCWWAAYPQILKLGRTLPLWIGGGMAFLIVVVLLFPKSIYFVGPLIAILAGIGVIWWVAVMPSRPRTVAAKRKAPSIAKPDDRTD